MSGDKIDSPWRPIVLNETYIITGWSFTDPCLLWHQHRCLKAYICGLVHRARKYSRLVTALALEPNRVMPSFRLSFANPD